MAARAIPTPALRKAAAISRVSLEQQVDNYSLLAQRKRIEELNQKYGPFTLPDENILDDGGYSGTNFNRPAFKRVLQLVREGVVQVVIFPYVDRFSRAVEGGLAMIRQIREAGAEVLLGEIGWVTNEGTCKILLCTMLGIAEAQRDSILEKSRTGVAIKVGKGLAHGGRSPYGWHFMSAVELAAEALKDGKPVPTGKPQNHHRLVPANIKVVKLMGKMALAGETAGAIAREMVARGIPSPRGGRQWHSAVVRNVLINEVYSTGVWHYGKREFLMAKRKRVFDPEPRGKTAPRFRPRSEWSEGQKLEGGAIWTPEQQAAIIEALTRTRALKRGRPAGPQGRASLLKSLVCCRLCGRAVTMRHKVQPNGKRSFWYRCTNQNYMTCKRECPALSVVADVLEEAVWAAWGNALTTELPNLVRDHFTDLRETTTPTDVDELRAQRDKLAKTRRVAMERELEADNDEDRRFYAGRVTELKAQIAVLNHRVTAATPEDAPAIDYQSIARDAAVAAGSKNPNVRREALLKSVDRIEWEGAEADMTLRIPVQNRVVNCNHGEPHGYNYLPLKVKVRLVA